MTKNVDSLYSLRLLGQAWMGVLIGVLFAMLLAAFLWPVGEGRPLVMPDEMLSWNLHNVWNKPREKGFYLLALLFGATGAYLTTTRFFVSRSIVLLVSLIVSIPLFNYLAVQVLRNNASIWQLLLVIGLFTVLFFLENRKAVRFISATIPQPRNSFRWGSYVSLLLILVLLLTPKSFIEVATRIGMEFHVGVFMIGPALYFLGHHLIPGLDYFTQYSVGMGWLFSHMLGTTAEGAILNYARFVIVAIFLFYAQMLWLLHWLYRTWVPAAIVTLLSLVFLFLTKVHFFAPSSTILHYPLMGVCAWMLARWIESPRSVTRHLALAIVLALSIFFNTETGIIFCLAVTLGCLLSSRQIYSALLPLFSLGISTLFFFLLLLLAVFGHRVLQQDFLTALVEPFLIYGKIGYGGKPIRWDMSDLNWFYNLVAPGTALATLALIARSAKSMEADRPRSAVLAFFATAGLLMLAKYVNMSIIAVWHVDEIGLLVTFVWWAHVLEQRFKDVRLQMPLFNYWVFASSVSRGVLILATLWIAAFSFDSRNPTYYALRSWIHYPALVSSLFHRQDHPCTYFDCVANRPAAKDVALIKERIQPGERVAIIDLWDWTYLASAHRPPLMFYLPVTTTFTKHQLQESLKQLKQARYLFIPMGANKEPYIEFDDMRNALMPTFHDVYVLDEEGERLAVWRRKDLSEK